MRQIFSIFKFFLFSFIFFSVFSSCTARVITISAGNTTNDSLTMLDEQGNPAYDIKVSAGEKINWKIDDPTSTVRAFTDMPLKTNKTQTGVLEERPYKKFLSSTWVGKVKSANEVKSGDEEYYNIKWTGNDGKEHTFDPRIQVNP